MGLPISVSLQISDVLTSHLSGHFCHSGNRDSHNSHPDGGEGHHSRGPKKRKLHRHWVFSLPLRGIFACKDLPHSPSSCIVNSEVVEQNMVMWYLNVTIGMLTRQAGRDSRFDIEKQIK